MRLILPPEFDKYAVIEDFKNGELVVEVTSSPGNVGKHSERLHDEAHPTNKNAGRMFHFTEAK